MHSLTRGRTDPMTGEGKDERRRAACDACIQMQAQYSTANFRTALSELVGFFAPGAPPRFLMPLCQGCRDKPSARGRAKNGRELGPNGPQK